MNNIYDIWEAITTIQSQEPNDQSFGEKIRALINSLDFEPISAEKRGDRLTIDLELYRHRLETETQRMCKQADMRATASLIELDEDIMFAEAMPENKEVMAPIKRKIETLLNKAGVERLCEIDDMSHDSIDPVSVTGSGKDIIKVVGYGYFHKPTNTMIKYPKVVLG